MKTHQLRFMKQIAVRAKRSGNQVSLNRITVKKTVVRVLTWKGEDTVYRCDSYRNAAKRKLDLIYSIESYVSFDGTFSLTEISKATFFASIR